MEARQRPSGLSSASLRVRMASRRALLQNQRPSEPQILPTEPCAKTRSAFGRQQPSAHDASGLLMRWCAVDTLVGLDFPCMHTVLMRSEASAGACVSTCWMLTSAGSASGAWPTALSRHAALHLSAPMTVLKHSKGTWRARARQDADS